MSEAIVFLGPSLGAAELRQLAPFEVRPPAAHGDIYRAVQDKPRAIGIVDGYFEGVPSVWHKEILHALDKGIHVFGAASMGALRAAELDGYGMRGVGRIYEGYRDGLFEDDGDVAVSHGPAEAGFVPLCEPMVNIHATLAAAKAEGRITEAEHHALDGLARRIHFKERSWERLLADAQSLGSGPSPAALTWLKANRIDQKRLDARAMVQAMDRLLANWPGPFMPGFAFEWTEAWDAAIGTFNEPQNAPDGVDAIIDEMRLDPEFYRRLFESVALRYLASRGMAAATSTAVNSRDIDTFRRQRGLLSRDSFGAFLTAMEMTEADLVRLLGRRIAGDAALVALHTRLKRAVLDEARLLGRYGEFKRRAESKKVKLADVDESALPTPPVLLGWYFDKRLGRAVPEDLDRHIAEIGLAERKGFYRLIRDEYLSLMTGDTA